MKELSYKIISHFYIYIIFEFRVKLLFQSILTEELKTWDAYIIRLEWAVD